MFDFYGIHCINNTVQAAPFRRTLFLTEKIMQNTFFAHELRVAVFRHAYGNSLQDDVNKWLSKQKKQVEVVEMLQSGTDTRFA